MIRPMFVIIFAHEHSLDYLWASWVKLYWGFEELGTFTPYVRFVDDLYQSWLDLKIIILTNINFGYYEVASD